MTKQETEKITLAELIMHQDQTIYRNALSILKRLREMATASPCMHKWNALPHGKYGCELCGLVK